MRIQFNPSQSPSESPKSDGRLHVTWPVSREVKTNGLGGLGGVDGFLLRCSWRFSQGVSVSSCQCTHLGMLGASICGYVVLG
jgi:hypothetical protein